MYRFAVIGGGWRALFFLRIAQEMPDRFQATSVLVRDPAKGEKLTADWGVPTCRTLDDLLRDSPDYVIVSVPWAVTPPMLTELAERGVPALAETPPAPDVDAMTALWPLARVGARIQVAEQYNFQPAHAARIAVARAGRLGTVTQAQVSVAHGYHGVSIIRAFLDAGFEDAAITAHRFTSPITASPDRAGPPREERVVDSTQTLAWLDFGGKLGVFDFTGDQYFSWIRSPRYLVRGERGELNNGTVRFLKDYLTPITLELARQDAGQGVNFEGHGLKGITLGEEWIYRNPFFPARLNDDEIAVATCMQRMGEYAAGGPGFYSLADACQDHYLGILIDRAAQSGETVRSSPQAWAREAPGV